MIGVEISELEKIADILFLMASNTDETLNALRRISAEMQEDLELKVYPQSTNILEEVCFGIESLNRANDTLQSLKHIVLSAVSEYQANEEKNKNTLARMSNCLESLYQGMNVAVTPGEIVHAEIASEAMNQNRVQELVAGSVQEMQIANIAAVSKVLEEEYSIDEVEDIKESQN